MSEVIKRSPITFNGVDGWEVLIEDKTITFAIACDRCIYRDWHDELECQAPCHIVHGCTMAAPSYFQFRQSYD